MSKPDGIGDSAVKSKVNLPLSQYPLGELLANTLTNVPAISTNVDDTVWASTGC